LPPTVLDQALNSRRQSSLAAEGRQAEKQKDAKRRAMAAPSTPTQSLNYQMSHLSPKCSQRLEGIHGRIKPPLLNALPLPLPSNTIPGPNLKAN
jgi:hypothetical protein